MKNIKHALVLLMCPALFCGLLVDAQAQARRPMPTGASAGSGKEAVVIKKMESKPQRIKVKTPEYRTDSSETQTGAREWACISVYYDTEAEWTDELEFRYVVVVHNDKTKAFVQFPLSVIYVDIPKGRNHVSTVFLRPNTLARYGYVYMVGVRVFRGGLQVAEMADDPKLWAGLDAVPIVPDKLLNRAQTPFALIAIDNYQAIKQK